MPSRPGEHQTVEGTCSVKGQTVRRSAAAAAWPPAMCDRILQAAHKTLQEEHDNEELLPEHMSLHACSRRRCWEAVPVQNASLPEENLRHELNKHAMTGGRYDFVTFEGEAHQAPRRVRAMVAHLHVTLGHLSNDPLARMLSLSGGQEQVIALARNLPLPGVCHGTSASGITPGGIHQAQGVQREADRRHLPCLGPGWPKVLGDALFGLAHRLPCWRCHGECELHLRSRGSSGPVVCSVWSSRRAGDGGWYGVLRERASPQRALRRHP